MKICVKSMTFIRGIVLMFIAVILSYGGEDDAFEMEEIVVNYLNEINPQVTEIGRDEIDRVGNAKKVDALLTEVAGIDVKRSSGGASKGVNNVSLRGLGDNRFLVLLDGRLLNGSGAMGKQYVDWSSISTDNIEKIVIIRGYKDAEYANSVSGVINIISKSSLDVSKTKISTSLGFLPYGREDLWSNRTYGLSYNQTKKINDIAGFKIYTNYNGSTPYLRNNYSDHLSFGTGLNLNLPNNFYLTLNSRFSYLKQGYIIENNPSNSNYNSSLPTSLGDGNWGPGIPWKGGDYYFGDRSYFTNFRSNYDISIKKEFNKITLSGLFYLNNQIREENYYDLNDTTHLVLQRSSKPDDFAGGWEAKLDHNIRDNFSLKYGITDNWQRVDGDNVTGLDTSFMKKKISSILGEHLTTQRVISIFTQGKIDFADNKLGVDAGFRFDRFRGYEDTTTNVPDTIMFGYNPTLTLSTHFWSGGTISVSGAYVYRFPGKPEYHWYYKGYNPEDDGISRKPISPEKSLQFEGMVSQRFSNNSTITARGYYNSIDDYICTIMGYQPSRVVYNIDNVNIAGVELEASLLLLNNLKLSGTYSYQQSHKFGDILDKSDISSESLLDIPKNRGSISASYNFTNGANIGTSLKMVGAVNTVTGTITKPNSSSLEVIDGYSTVSLFGVLPLVNKDSFEMGVRATVDNLFDVEYQEVYGYPMAGINTNIAVDVEF